MSSYQEARSGVVISWEARQQIHMNLKQGKLTDLFIPVKEHQRLIERLLPVEPQQIVAKDKSADNHSLALNRNSILLLGIGFGIITSLVVAVLIYIFILMTSVRNQPTQSPSQNALPRTAPPTTKISPKP